jgi:hypothetical protein
MKKRVLCIVLSLSFLACLAAVKGTFAWISFTDEIKTHMLDIGRLQYDVIGELNSNYHNAQGKALIVPGDNLIVVPVEEESTTGGVTTGAPSVHYQHSPLILKNYSTIDTQVRLKIEYTYYETAAQTVPSSAVYQGLSSEKLQVNFPSEMTCTYNSTDGYWYCSTENGVIPAVVSEEETGSTGETTTSSQLDYEDIELIESVFYKGTEYDKTYEGKEVSVTITLQAKQAYYVDWEDITQLNL